MTFPQHFLHVRTRWALLPLLLAGLLLGCGGDDGGGSTAPQSGSERMRDSVSDLADRGMDTIQEPQNQLLLDPRMLSPMTALPLPDASIDLPQTMPSDWLPNSRRLADGVIAAMTLSQPRSAVEPRYGTYDFDPQDPTAPFVYWKLTNEGSPDDGFIFRFGLEDGFTVVVDGEPVAYRGEVRLLDVVIDDAGTLTFDDDLLTGFRLEVAAAAEGLPLTTFLALPVAMTLDESREISSLSVGDAEASSPGAPGAAFLGDLVFSASLATSPNPVAGQDVEASLRLFDSVRGFMMGFALGVIGVDEVEETPERVDVLFEWGATFDPGAAPWAVDVTLDEFRDHPTEPEEIAMDIAGEIREDGVAIADFAGTSLEVAVDVDGDPATEETCVDVDIQFPDTDPVNVCVFFAGLLSSFDGTLAASLLPAP